MFSWISDHFFGIVALAAFIFGGKALLGWMSSRSVARGPGIAFCNKCGFKGAMRKRTRLCGRCGSPKVTLATS